MPNIALSSIQPDAIESQQLSKTPSFGPVRQRALRETVFEVLLLAIVRGEMKPGVWSNHKLLAEQLHVSVTPLREALQELAACCMIENHYNRGTIVRPFGPEQLSELFYVRALLEAEAARLACARMDRANLCELQSQTTELMSKQDNGWISSVINSDDNFHTSIANACGNQRLKEEILRYRSLLASIRRAIADHYYPFDLALPEHLVIIEALLKHQPDDAAKAMTRHILSAAKVCSDLLFPKVKAKN
jgi:DNA-binding GntR family transcriptional regulator